MNGCSHFGHYFVFGRVISFFSAGFRTFRYAVGSVLSRGFAIAIISKTGLTFWTSGRFIIIVIRHLRRTITSPVPGERQSGDRQDRPNEFSACKTTHATRHPLR